MSIPSAEEKLVTSFINDEDGINGNCYDFFLIVHFLLLMGLIHLDPYYPISRWMLVMQRKMTVKSSLK